MEAVVFLLLRPNTLHQQRIKNGDIQTRGWTWFETSLDGATVVASSSSSGGGGGRFSFIITTKYNNKQLIIIIVCVLLIIIIIIISLIIQNMLLRQMRLKDNIETQKQPIRSLHPLFMGISRLCVYRTFDSW